MARCEWGANPSMIEYHDTEWGVPLYDDNTIFEFLTLEGAQAGLSWEIVLKKRDGYRKAFKNFDVKKVAKMTQKDVEKLVQNPEIVRNRMKIEATINNAKRFMEVQKEFGSFAKYMWSFVDGKPIVNKFKTMKDLPAKTEISDVFSKDLKKRGFKFIGSTIVYAHMQATGMVNDHQVSCPRYKEVQKLAKKL